MTDKAFRQWCLRFGLDHARGLRRRRGQLGDTWYLDELVVKNQGRQQYLWRAVDEDGDAIDILKLLKRKGLSQHGSRPASASEAGVEDLAWRSGC